MLLAVSMYLQCIRVHCIYLMPLGSVFYSNIRCVVYCALPLTWCRLYHVNFTHNDGEALENTISFCFGY